MQNITLENKDSIIFSGRVILSHNRDKMYFNWSGSGFSFRFSGTRAEAYLFGTVHDDEELPRHDDRAYIGVFVDDQPYLTARFPLDRREGWYTLAEDLPEGFHTVRVIKDTEVGYGRAAVSELRTDGAFEKPEKSLTQHIEFIGDSITCGYGNICSNKSSEFVTAEESFSSAFTFLTAQRLNMGIYCVAASGNGVFHDYGCCTHNLIPELYKYTDKMFSDHCGEKPDKWDCENDGTAVTVIKLGQNDAQYCSGADLPEQERTEKVIYERRALFECRCMDFIKEVRELRPKTPIIYIIESDMYLKKEILSAIKKVDCGIIPLEIHPKYEFEGVGANGHWSVSTHARVALLLSFKIGEIL